MQASKRSRVDAQVHLMNCFKLACIFNVGGGCHSQLLRLARGEDRIGGGIGVVGPDSAREGL